MVSAVLFVVSDLLVHKAETTQMWCRQYQRSFRKTLRRVGMAHHNIENMVGDAHPASGKVAISR